VATTDRRKDPRMSLSVPVRVQGHDADGSAWEEMTNSDETSFGGVSFALRHPAAAGQVLQLAIPLPKRFRRYDLSDSSYRIYALVRDLRPAGAGARVGVMFLGRTPPRGYEHNPGGRYLLPSDPSPQPRERRKCSRLDLFLNLKLQRSQAGSLPAEEEQTVAENVGKKGARVMTSMTVSKGEVVVVQELGGPFRTRAEIKNIYIGKDNVPRLNLCFLDGEAPDRLVSVR
jgi:hypothetical protein